MKKPAIFLDRDNTINYDPGYLHETDKVKLLKNAKEGLTLLKKVGFLLIVISNQSGVGRGYFPVSDVYAVNDKINQLLGDDAKIDAFYFCPHAPEENCNCRKPKTGLIDFVKKDFDIDFENSFMVGDKKSDVEFGHNIGVKTVFIGNKNSANADFCAKDLLGVAKIILKFWHAK